MRARVTGNGGYYQRGAVCLGGKRVGSRGARLPSALEKDTQPRSGSRKARTLPKWVGKVITPNLN